MKRFSILLLWALFASTAVVFTACNDDEEDLQETLDSAEDNAVAENEVESVRKMLTDLDGRSGKTQADTLTVLPSGAAVTRTEDTAAGTVTFEVDFGNTPLLCNDGIYRQGQFTATRTGDPGQVGVTWNFRTTDYIFNAVGGSNGTKFELVQTVKYVADDNNGNRIDSISVTTGRLTFDDGSVSNWTSERTRARVSGGDTPQNVFDDVFQVTGQSVGTNRKGVNYTATISEPLKFNMACLTGVSVQGRSRHYVAGEVTLQTENNNNLILNYDPVGGEPCDRVARIQFNDFEPRVVTLRR